MEYLIIILAGLCGLFLGNSEFFSCGYSDDEE